MTDAPPYTVEVDANTILVRVARLLIRRGTIENVGMLLSEEFRRLICDQAGSPDRFAV